MQNSQHNYEKIALAIDYIRNNFKQQPSLETIAKEIGWSEFHFQRVFTEWAGVSPKKFIQYLSIEYAKKCIRKKENNLFEVAEELGLSGTSRLHDLFVTIEGMTPGEYKNEGAFLQIKYFVYETMFGNILIASTHKGICYTAFTENKTETLLEVQTLFPKADFKEEESELHQHILPQFNYLENTIAIKLHLKASPFQLKVWNALLQVGSGELTSYAGLAAKVNHPNASRAVGTAVAQNPIALIIPCHRVIKSTGEIGQYHWGTNRKHALIALEATKKTAQ